MNRIIKFRIIHKNKIVGYEHLTNNGWKWNWIELNPDKGERWCKGVIDDSTPIAMDRNQFTGLLDKNGKEIYEKDNLLWKGIIVTVKWSQQACAYWMVWKSTTENNKVINHFQEMNANYVSDIYILDTVEVIGNIYETPSLINP